MQLEASTRRKLLKLYAAPGPPFMSFAVHASCLRRAILSAIICQNILKSDDDVANPMTGWDHEGLRRGAPLAQGLQDKAAAAGGTSGEAI